LAAEARNSRAHTPDGAELVDFMDQVVRDETEPTRVRIEVSVVADHSLMALARRLSAEDVEALRARAQRYDVDGDGEAIDG
jgi:hypothetical protein